MPDQPIKTHLPSVAQLIISIFGLVTSLFSSLALLLLLTVGSSLQTTGIQTNQSIFMVVWFGIIISIVTLPSIILSIRRLARLAMPGFPSRKMLILSSIAFLIIIPLVYILYKNNHLLSNSFLKVLFSFITVAIPLWWFVELGQSRLKNISPQRFWGLINFQLFAGLPILLVVEVTLFILALILGGAWLATNNVFKPIMMTLQTQLMLDPNDMTTLINQISPLLQLPEVIAALFFSISIVTPLVEELIKPLALWFFIKQSWTESEGFSAGLVCGAAFALMESVSAIVTLPQENWTALLIARIGTGLLHTLTAGLTGWGLVSAWKNGNFKRLGITYLISMSLHGLWNFFALLIGFDMNLNILSNTSLVVLSNSAPWVLGSLFALMLAALIIMNRKIRTPLAPPPIPPLLS